jgi:hypothetical protein
MRKPFETHPALFVSSTMLDHPSLHGLDDTEAVLDWTKGCLSRDGMLHMMFKLGQCAEKKWRRLRGFDYLTKVITGVKFKDGVEVTKVDLVAA